MLYVNGEIIHTAHKIVTAPRTESRCVTGYGETYPNVEGVPAHYRGKVGDPSTLEWGEVTTISTSGDHVYYDNIRKRSGRPFTYHFQFGSSTAANEFAAAARVLAAACNGGKPDVAGQALEEVVHDSQAGSASLAVDRRQGSRYGWAIDYANWDQSDARALLECQRNGGSCQIVLRFTGGCGAYAAD